MSVPKIKCVCLSVDLIHWLLASDCNLASHHEKTALTIQPEQQPSVAYVPADGSYLLEIWENHVAVSRFASEFTSFAIWILPVQFCLLHLGPHDQIHISQGWQSLEEREQGLQQRQRPAWVKPRFPPVDSTWNARLRKTLNLLGRYHWCHIPPSCGKGWRSTCQRSSKECLCRVGAWCNEWMSGWYTWFLHLHLRH